MTIIYCDATYVSDIRSLEIGGMRSRERRRNSIEPKGELASRTLAMPADCNPRGDIFGGWIMALMDSAGKCRRHRMPAGAS